jgi:hypothetical protein
MPQTHIELVVHAVHRCVAHDHPVVTLRVRDTSRYFVVALAPDDARVLSPHWPPQGDPGRRRLMQLMETVVSQLGGKLTAVELTVGSDRLLQATLRVATPRGGEQEPEGIAIPVYFADGLALAQWQWIPLRMAEADVARIPLSTWEERLGAGDDAPEAGSDADLGPAGEPATEMTPSLVPFRAFIETLDLDGLEGGE